MVGNKMMLNDKKWANNWSVRISGRRNEHLMSRNKTRTAKAVQSPDSGEQVELRGIMWMPQKDSLAESARDVKYFTSFNAMIPFISAMYEIPSDKIFIGSVVANGIGICNLMKVIPIGIEGAFVNLGYCFTRYYPAMFENARRMAM